MVKPIFWSLAVLAYLISTPISVFAVEEGLQRTKKDVRINTWSNQAEIFITETWKNTRTEPLTFSLLQPLPKDTNSEKIFLNAVGQEYQLLSGEDRIDAVFSEAQKTQAPRPLKKLNIPYEKVLYKNFVLPPESETEIKYQWTQALDFIDNFYFTTVFWSDGIASQKLHAQIIRNGVPKHTVSNFFIQGVQYQNAENFVWEWDTENANPIEDFVFFFAETPSATLKFPYQDFTYQAEFKTTEKKPLKKITLLIDQSGSMYGPRWNRVQKIIPEILKQMAPETNIEIGLFDDEVFWLQDSPRPNNFESQKDWVTQLKNLTPTGSSNWAFLEELIQQKSDTEAFLLLGDFADWETDPTEFKNLLVPIFTLDFSENQNLEFISHKTKGQYLHLFQSTTEFPEKDAFSTLFALLKQKIPNPFLNPENNEQLPQTYHFLSGKSAIQLRRVPEIITDGFSPIAAFIPRWWGQYQIAKHLRTQRAQGADETLKNALVSIKQFFGIHTPVNIPQDLTTLSDKTLWETIWDLESNQPNTAKNQYWKGAPFYPEILLDPVPSKKITARPNLHIAPFSQAQKELLKRFPNLSDPFGLGAKNFCLPDVCLRVEAGGTQEFSGALLLPWKNISPDHWVYPSLQTLAERNIFPVTKESPLDLEKNISRGEFMHWTSQTMFPEAYQIPETTEPLEISTKPETLLPLENRENPSTENNPKLNRIIKKDTSLPKIPALKNSPSIIETIEVNILPIFKDLPNDPLMKKSIEILHQKGIVQGFEDGTVRPETSLNRAEAVKILLAMNNITPAEITSQTEIPFSDLIAWERRWVLEAYRRNIVQGYPDGTFKPFSPLNRAEATKLIVESLWESTK